ncbi:hemin-degrading factor [Mesorhizobium xinjiangense]|uniref:hemin-degrading factor n=1 Tax=Mesorhizobium xinjiangense TaxID=2678685 RepID=UPI0012EED617|nr:ChuX/HutX family heme-like substrate-binding protein [Mesorhizobium xinjiangense]
MTIDVRPTPEAIRAAWADNPKMRERDLANQLGISEAEFVAAYCGISARRIVPDVDKLLGGIGAVGEVMALTRNESAVHEKIGPYDKPVAGKHAAMVLGAEIDLRIFPKHWVHGFAVEKADGEQVRRSLQFFDAAGEAVHKIHLRPSSDVEAYERLVRDMLAPDQSQTVAIATDGDKAEEPAAEPDLTELRRRWGTMTDVHQFAGILRDMKLTRRKAVEVIGRDFAWRLDNGAVEAMMRHAAQEDDLPIMCFVGNRGCIQIHSGPIREIKPMGPWLNVMDPTFHLHLRLDHIAEVWAVRKPNKDGHVTSIEAYGADGSMIIQFFGKRKEGVDERPDWRFIVENLPQVPHSTAA